MQQTPGILTDVFERITDAFVALDSNWCYTYMNKKAGEIFQRNPDDMIGKHIWTEFPEGIDQTFYKAFYKAMAEQQYIHVEEYYPPYDKWFENHIYPSPDGLSIFFRDITEQKKTKRELEIRDKHFQVLLENNLAIIALTDDNLNSIYRSPSSTRITGWTDEDMIASNAINRVHPDDLIKLKITVTEAIEKPGIPQDYLVRYLHKNGHYIWLEGTATKLTDESIIKGIVFNSRDVTEKVELEQLMLKATRLARIGSWNVDLIKQTVYWNDITREIHEAEKTFVPDLATGLNFYKEGHGRELITQKVKAAIEWGKPWDEELEIVTVKNNVRWIRTIGEPEFVDGKCVKIYGSFQDIDRRKRAEEKIIESEEKFRQTFERISDGFVALDKNWRYTYMNKQAGEITHLDPKLIIGKNIWTVSPDLIGSQFYKAYHKAKEEQKYVNLEEYYPVFNQWFENHIYPSPDGLTVYFKDITERKKAEEKILFEQLDKMALINSTDDFIWSISKDLKLIAANNSFLNNIKTVTGVDLKPGDEILLKVFPQEFLNLWQSYYNRALLGESFREETYSNYSADNSSTWIETAFNPIYHNQDIIGIACYSRNITERKNAEEEIKKYNERFQLIARTTNDALWEWNFETGELWANQMHQHLYDLDISDPVPTQKAWEQKIHPADRENVIATKKNAYESDTKIWISEYRFETKNGFIDIYDRCYIIRNADGKAIRATGTMMDITERKKAEEALRLSENRIRRIFESDMIGFFYWDVKGEILDANDRFLEMTGYSKQDLNEHKINWSKITPPEYKALDLTAIEQVVNTGICQPYEKEYIRKDGSRLSILIGATALEGSNFGMGVSYVLDITERIKAEKKLKENENYLRTILDTEPECVKILNLKGALVSMNPAGLAMVEADKEEQVLGHQMTELVVDKYRDGFNNLSKAVFKGKQGSFEFEITGLKGGHRWLETHAVPLKDASGKISGLLGVTRDITERKKTELEIGKATEELRELTKHLQTIREEERKRIAREIHDELGQQLTAIKMDTVWIDKKIPTATFEVKNKLRNIIELLDGSHQSVRKILNELRPAVLDDNSLLETLQWQGQQFTENTGTPVFFKSNQQYIKLPPETATCIFRVYQESLTNIMRYAGAVKVITSLSVTDENIFFTVQDDGKGFDTAMAERNQKFGLLGMRERVHALNGIFNLTSSPGKGTTIKISLPYLQHT